MLAYLLGLQTIKFSLLCYQGDCPTNYYEFVGVVYL